MPPGYPTGARVGGVTSRPSLNRIEPVDGLLDFAGQFAGRYSSLTQLVEGHAIDTFRGVHTLTGRAVFIKVSGSAPPSPHLGHLLREAATLRELEGAGCPVLPIIDEGEVAGRPFIVQDWVAGANLAELADRGELTARRFFDALVGVLGALEHIHRAGYVHGDVSADNILFGSRDDGPAAVYLIDFNSAQPLATVTSPDLFVKPSYTAPEVAAGSQPSPRSDLYSLGVVAYRLLAGALPIAADRSGASSTVRVDAPRFPPVSRVPALLEEFIRSLLEAQPEARPTSAAAALLTATRLREQTLWAAPGEGPIVAPAPASPVLPPSPTMGSFARPDFGIPPPFSHPITVSPTFEAAEAPSPAPGVPSAPDQMDEVSMAAGIEAQAHGRFDLSVFAPPLVQPGASFVLEVWAFTRHDRDEALSRAARGNRRIERGSRGPLQAEVGDAITLALRMDGFELDGASESFNWTGEITNVPFLVTAPSEMAHGVYPGRLSVLRGGLLLARVVFDVEIGGAAAGAPRGLASTRRYYSTAFASYASEDRGEVLRRVQGIGVTGIDVFIDILSLRAGEDWEAGLYENIRSRDVFYLFWSRAASRSAFVDREWRYALSEKGLDAIHPVPLEPPNLVPPPVELNSRHFNDLYLACLRGEDFVQRAR